MQEVYRNIYKTARKAAGLTQERWAEQLAIRRADIKRHLPGVRPGWGCACRGAAGGEHQRLPLPGRGFSL